MSERQRSGAPLSGPTLLLQLPRTPMYSEYFVSATLVIVLSLNLLKDVNSLLEMTTRFFSFMMSFSPDAERDWLTCSPRFVMRLRRPTGSKRLKMSTSTIVLTICLGTPAWVITPLTREMTSAKFQTELGSDVRTCSLEWLNQVNAASLSVQDDDGEGLGAAWSTEFINTDADMSVDLGLLSSCISRMCSGACAPHDAFGKDIRFADAPTYDLGDFMKCRSILHHNATNIYSYLLLVVQNSIFCITSLSKTVTTLKETFLITTGEINNIWPFTSGHCHISLCMSTSIDGFIVGPTVIRSCSPTFSRFKSRKAGATFSQHIFSEKDEWLFSELLKNLSCASSAVMSMRSSAANYAVTTVEAAETMHVDIYQPRMEVTALAARHFSETATNLHFHRENFSTLYFPPVYKIAVYLQLLLPLVVPMVTGLLLDTKFHLRSKRVLCGRILSR